MALLIMGIAMIVISKKEKHNQVTVAHDLRAGAQWRQKLYLLISRNPISKNYVLGIRRRYQLIVDLKEHQLRLKTVNSFLIIVAVGVFTIAVFARMTKEPLMVLFSIIVVYFLAESIMDVMVTRLGNKIMSDQVDFHEKLRHYYYEYGDVAEAVYHAADELSEECPEMSMQGMKIHDILLSKTVEEDIIDYNDTAPNRFLKMLLGLIYTSMEYGDSKDDKGRSQLLNNMAILNQEIRLEVFKIDKINYFLRSLNLIVLAPLLAMGPLKSWASSNFYPLQKFYESSLGLVVEMAMYIIVILSYYIIRQMQKLDGGRPKKVQKLTSIHWVNGIVANIAPVKYTKRRYKIEKLLKGAGESNSVREYFARKIALASIGFLLSVIVVFSLHFHTVTTLLTTPDIDAVKENFLGGKLSEPDRLKAEEVTTYDAKILKKTSYSDNEEIISQMILVDSLLSEEQVRNVTERIKGKAIVIKKAYFKWYELIICVLIGVIFYSTPTLLLMFQRRVVQIEMENEVSTFQSTVLMLIHIERMSVDEVLEWLSKYAVVFKEPLEECLTEFDSGAYEALEKMKDAIEYKGMKDLIASLQTAVNSLSLEDAFDELESDKEHFFKVREETNKRIIEKKIGSGRIVGFTPLYALIGLYFGFPLLYSSAMEMLEFYNKINY